MYDLAVKLESSEQLIEALCLLNYLLSNSPSNFHAKLLCLQIYQILGCGWGAQKTYESLDIKHVQLDSMGYLHCAQLPILGIYSLAKPLYDSTLKFFTASYKESLEYLAMCYKFGSFSKLQEFMDFRDRLSNSLHYALISAEALLVEMICLSGPCVQNVALVKGLNIEPAIDRIAWHELTDNRDLDIIERWDPKFMDLDEDGNPIEELSPCKVKEDSFQQDMELLRVRSMILRLISACVEAITKDETDKAAIQTLISMKQSWSEIMCKIKEMNLQPFSNRFLVNLFPSRLHGILVMPYEIFFTNLIRFTLALEHGNESIENFINELETSITEVGQLLADTITKHNQSADLLWNRRKAQEIVVNVVEVKYIHNLFILIRPIN